MSSPNAESTLTDAKVRIITNSDIRYEGTLYKINATEKTIALKDVSSFGTEDRRPDRILPPSSLVYEYIVFRSAEIKDLIVLKNAETAPKDDPKPEPEKPKQEAQPEKAVPVHTEEKKPEKEIAHEKEAHRPHKEYNDRPRNDNRNYNRDRRDHNYQNEHHNRPNYKNQVETPHVKFQFDEMLKNLQIIEKDKDETKDKYKDKKYNDNDFFDGISTSVNSNDRREIEDYKDKKMSNETFGYVPRSAQPHYKSRYNNSGHQGREGGNYRGNEGGNYRGHEGGYNNRHEGGYNNRQEGGYKNRHEGGYNQRQDGGYNQKPEGGQSNNNYPQQDRRPDFNKKRGRGFAQRDNEYVYVKKED